MGVNFKKWSFIKIIYYPYRAHLLLWLRKMLSMH